MIADVFPEERDRLRRAVAATIESFVTRDATAEQLTAWAGILESFNSRVADVPPEAVLWGISGHRGIMGVMGIASPGGFSSVSSSTGDSISARLTFVERHEGNKGLAHGGMIAQAFDDFCGLFDPFVPGIHYTGQLNVRFLKPVPLEKDVTFEGAVIAKEGSRKYIEAKATIDGVVHAEADAMMVAKPQPN